jgi:hypothetical protein
VVSVLFLLAAVSILVVPVAWLLASVEDPRVRALGLWAMGLGLLPPMALALLLAVKVLLTVAPGQQANQGVPWLLAGFVLVVGAITLLGWVLFWGRLRTRPGESAMGPPLSPPGGAVSLLATSPGSPLVATASGPSVHLTRLGDKGDP